MTSALAVYVLPDYAAKRLAKAHPEKKTVNRIGLTTSTKLGGAVTRSRCRRIMREGLRALEKEKTLKAGFLIVIAARSASVKLKSTEIKRQLEANEIVKISLLKTCILSTSEFKLSTTIFKFSSGILFKISIMSIFQVRFPN